MQTFTTIGRNGTICSEGFAVRPVPQCSVT